jgi:hypothetical protein
VTTPDQLRAIVRYLQDRVQLATEGKREIAFDLPKIEKMVADGLDEATVRRLSESPWWPEMIDDVVDTPDFAEPDEPADVVLGYARDVVSEYIRKRFPLSG